ATRRLVARGGAAYMVAVTLAYTAYAAGTAPTVAASVLPAQVAARMATIGAEDVSFQARLLCAADAVRVALERPWLGGGGGAWNALYHQYQSTVYWTTEVHNHLAQVWVEAGLVGLAGFLGLLVGLVWAGRRALARLPRDAAALTATAGAAAATLFLHSVFDFDLSLAALGVALFGLAGVVRGTCAAHAPVARLPFGERLPWPRRPRARQVGAVLLGLMLGTALLLTAGRLYRAGVEGAQGARAMAAGDLARAAAHYHLAVRLDPFTPEYRADLAQLWAVRAVARDDAVARYRALALAREAAARAPYDAVLRGTLRNVYMMLREYDLAVAEAMAVVTANPLVGAHWELLGQTLVAAALGVLSQADGGAAGAPAGPETGNLGTARAWLERAAALPEELAAAEARLNREAAFGRRTVDRPPGLWLAAGQAHYLLGRYTEAVSLLERARLQKAPAGEVLVWLAAAHARRGEADRARALLEEAARADAGARDRYREVLALGPVGG
ncbi:MAG: O-antigen ligase family protein, partial [Firmicutes bacterium]|nr:O-antigen ligase family protein [Bacillota bacterium]